MKRMIGGVGTAWLLAFVAFAVLAMGLFHPYHRIVAGSIYAVSWVPFCLAFRNKRRWLKKRATTAHGFFKDYKWDAAFGLSLVFFGYALLVLVPIESSPIAWLEDTELSSQIEQDTETVLYLDLRMQETLRLLKDQAAQATTDSAIPADQRTALRDTWQQFVETSFELDLIKRRYKTFAQVNAFTRPTLHAEAFLLCYGAFLTQYTHALALQSLVADRPAMVTLLNEENAERAIPANTYFRLKQRITHPNDILRLNVGRGYLEMVRNQIDARKHLAERVDQLLHAIDTSLDEYPELVVENPMEKIEKVAFDTWFPLQKGVALNLSYIRTASREYLISPKMLAEYREQIQPGDILLERREWHATNVGIPGYWTHAAMYVGTTEELDAHFLGLSDLEEGVTASRAIEKAFPKAYAELRKSDPQGYPYSIIEAKRPGVILTSLEESAAADSLAILRPRLSRSGQLQVVLRSFSYLGRPYDYSFDFRTDNALVCSELIYKAYEGEPGFTLTTEQLNGRPVLPPNHFGKKFDVELGTANQQLDLVLFLDGNEVTGTAIERDEQAFRSSWQRPKWHILKDYAPAF